MTECIATDFDFHPLGRREVIGRFDGGAITSDAGGLLLRELEVKTGLLRRFAACFTDHRNPDLIEHSVLELLTQRVFGLCPLTAIAVRAGRAKIDDFEPQTAAAIPTTTKSLPLRRQTQRKSP